jgi:hypothetical protein
MKHKLYILYIYKTTKADKAMGAGLLVEVYGADEGMPKNGSCMIDIERICAMFMLYIFNMLDSHLEARR